jgi:hypothetical protein
MRMDTQRLEIERFQVREALESTTDLFSVERDRLTSLEQSTVTANGQGEILNASAAIGRHVNAGDTLARMVDCSNAFVVAIFSYRQGVNLSPGTRVNIDGGSTGTQGGTVTEVLPKTSDKVDETYAVPFPQTERRELYVLVHPDTPLRTLVTDGGHGRCDIGQWVTVTRVNGWVPSVSVIWREAGRLLSAAAFSFFPRSWANTPTEERATGAATRWSTARQDAMAGAGVN